MALNLNPEAVSIDAKINRIAKRIFPRLNSKWELNTPEKQLQGYGRVYVRQDKSGKVPKAFLKNRDYTKTLLTADKSKFFFIKNSESKRIEGTQYYTTKVDLCFLVDLEKLKPGSVQMADEKVHVDVANELRFFSGQGVFENGYITEIENVFRGMDFDFKDDIQPRHAFKFMLTIEYKLDEPDC